MHKQRVPRSESTRHAVGCRTHHTLRAGFCYRLSDTITLLLSLRIASQFESCLLWFAELGSRTLDGVLNTRILRGTYPQTSQQPSCDKGKDGREERRFKWRVAEAQGLTRTAVRRGSKQPAPTRGLQSSAPMGSQVRSGARRRTLTGRPHKTAHRRSGLSKRCSFPYSVPLF